MALVTKDFSINITPGEMPPIIHVSEYDIGRAFNVTLIGENRNAFEIPTGTTATVEGTLNGTVGFTTSATISNNQITFALSQSMTAYSGKAWCKIKLTQNSQPIQTCAFVLAVDRAGVEADTILGGSGFQEQINEGIAEYFDNDPPFFELPEGGQVGQALLSDGADGSYWGEAGIPDAVKTALLDCFENVAWINDQGQTYYDELYAALNGETPAPTPTPITTTWYNWSAEFGTNIDWYAAFNNNNNYGYSGFWAKVTPNKSYKVTLSGKRFNRFKIFTNDTFDPENIVYSAGAQGESLYPLVQVYAQTPNPSDTTTEQTFETTVSAGNNHWLAILCRSALTSNDNILTCNIVEV